MEQTACFISRPRRIEELREFGIGLLRPYQIVSTVCLGGIDYENFVTDLLADRAFLENVPGCGEDGPLVRCLCVSSRGRDSILVLPDGTGHIALAALVLAFRGRDRGAYCAPLPTGWKLSSTSTLMTASPPLCSKGQIARIPQMK